MFDILSNCIDSTLIDEYAVIIHGDFGSGNIMFKYEVDADLNKPTAVCFFDYQMACLVSPVLDLTTIIFSSTDKKLRDEHYHKLIEEYYCSLCSALEELDCDGKQLLPYDTLRQHLKKYSIFGLYWAIVLIFIQFQNTTETMSTAIELGPFCSDLKDFESFSSKVTDLILDFEKLEYNFECQ